MMKNGKYQQASQAEIDDGLRAVEIMRTAMKRADATRSQVIDAMFEPGPPGSGFQWVLKTEPLPHGAYEVEE